MRPLAFQLAKKADQNEVLNFDGSYDEQQQIWVGKGEAQAYFTKCTEPTLIGFRQPDMRTFICDQS